MVGNYAKLNLTNKNNWGGPWKVVHLGVVYRLGISVFNSPAKQMLVWTAKDSLCTLGSRITNIQVLDQRPREAGTSAILFVILLVPGTTAQQVIS